MKSDHYRKITPRQSVILRSAMSCLTILALTAYFTTAPTSIANGKEPQSTKDSTSKDTSSGSASISQAETNSTSPSKGTTGMSTSSMEYEPMYPADKPDWIFKDPYWNNEGSAFIVHVSGDLEVSKEACSDHRIEGSIDALCDDLDKHIFKQSPPSKQVPEIVAELREILEYMKLGGRFTRENGDENFRIEGIVLEVNTAEGKRYQLWRKIEISKVFLKKWEVYHNRTYHPERFRNVGFGLLSILGVLGLAHVGVKNLGRKKIGNDTFQTTTYR